MSHSVLIRLLSVFLVFVALAVSPATAANLQPSRPPLKGCSWQPFESRELGLSLLTQNCTDPKARYVFSAKDSWLEMHRPADDLTFGGPRVLQVLTKPADQDIKAAIREQFISKLDKEAQAGCEVVALRKKLKYGRVAYEIRPAGNYAAKVNKRLEEPGDFGCGEYGKQQDTVYFEYHPEETRSRYLFVVFGWDEEALFDEQSITLMHTSDDQRH